MANVEEDPTSYRWVKSEAYNRLDQSEKSAVSYFLGMTQAKVTCEMLLGVPHLVHLDAVLALLGETTKKSRPDFVGFDLASMSYTLAVEAKGRTHGWTAKVTETAKLQAGLLPTIVNTTSDIRVASIAYFNTDGAWEAYLEDPPAVYTGLDDRLTIATLLVTYYRPLVAALLTEGLIEDRSSDNQTVIVRLPAIDIWLGVPRVVVNILRELRSVERLTKNQMEAAGADIAGAIAGLPSKTAASRTSETWQARGLSEVADPTVCTGLDGVQVRLGESWPADRLMPFG